ncbi:MAG TPA: alpha-D-ribose 1-methylphosphonate 5-triphosphate diphosphatase [Rhodospirillaceae bacterium]|nr:alpha-D-ribose 1-methylphosphonate 5-triphosphate diphosphatase [Rhodospirillaceae bacterium]
MTQEIILTGARIVTATEVIEGTAQVVDGIIRGLASGGTAVASAIDCEGDLLLPGLVELHTDNLEKHMTPRPKVRWPAPAAVLAHDSQMATAGITTVYDAISLGDMIEGSERHANVAAMVDAVTAASDDGLLRADHRLHLRCEVSSATVMTLFTGFADNPLVGIVSLMDHTPGQRQFVREQQYRDYYMGKYGFNAEEMAAFSERQILASATYSARHRAEIAALAREMGLVLASHDDATLAHVEEAADFKVSFSEFPTTLEAAKAARQRDMHVLVGAPNLVRGGSHSGNISAAELAEHRCLDMLSSDYVPVSLLHGAFLLVQLGYPLPEAVATVSGIPAAVAGLGDRGAIQSGKRADLLRVTDHDGLPVVRAVWREGERVA